jgi:hypothetical protein
VEGGGVTWQDTPLNKWTEADWFDYLDSVWRIVRGAPAGGHSSQSMLEFYRALLPDGARNIKFLVWANSRLGIQNSWAIGGQLRDAFVDGRGP